MTLESATDQELAQETNQDNPLVWSILGVLKGSSCSWKVHSLAAELIAQGLLPELDKNPDQDLFKRNFLLMNALFQLQSLLLPQQWLQVHAMDIEIYNVVPNDFKQALAQDSGLRDYYLDWDNYQTSDNLIREMLAQFWHRFEEHIGTKKTNATLYPRDEALMIFELDPPASNKEIRRQWRRLALRWHPDRRGGDAAKFRVVCEAWQILRC